MSKKILIVDDEPELIEIISDALLTIFPDATFESAPNGEEGFAKATIIKFDIIVTDQKMPKKTGVEMIASIRTQVNLNSKTPILMLTGFLDKQLRAALKSRGIAFAEKPIQMETFTKEILSIS